LLWDHITQGAMDIIASSLGTPLRRGGYLDDDIDGITNVESHSNRTADFDPTAHSQGEDGNAQGVRTAESMDVVYVVQAKGSPRRCGGLGDILSGTTAAALHWALEVSEIFPLLSAQRATVGCDAEVSVAVSPIR
jgi:hypothetical protein